MFYVSTAERGGIMIRQKRNTSKNIQIGNAINYQTC